MGQVWIILGIYEAVTWVCRSVVVSVAYDNRCLVRQRIQSYHPLNLELCNLKQLERYFTFVMMMIYGLFALVALSFSIKWCELVIWLQWPV